MSLPFLAVTGGIACGKSTVARMLPEFGGDVLDTDEFLRFICKYFIIFGAIINEIVFLISFLGSSLLV